MSPYKNILVLCQGNICRSPVAEAMLRQQLPGKQIQSAGLTAMVGQGVDATAGELATAEGLDTQAHVARQVTQDMIQWADLVLVMSQRQRSQVGKIVPEAIGKTMLLGHWIQHNGTGANNGTRADIGMEDIPDPYKKSRDVFEHVHKLMHQGVSLWAKKI